MKSKILALLICGCLAVTGLTACSSNPDNNNSATDENAGDKNNNNNDNTDNNGNHPTDNDNPIENGVNEIGRAHV